MIANTVDIAVPQQISELPTGSQAVSTTITARPVMGGKPVAVVISCSTTSLPKNTTKS